MFKKDTLQIDTVVSLKSPHQTSSTESVPPRAEKSQSARGPSEGPGSSVSEAEHYLGGEQARLLKVPSSTQVSEIHVYWVSSKPCLPDTEGRKTGQPSNCHHTQDSRDKVHYCIRAAAFQAGSVTEVRTQVGPGTAERTCVMELGRSGLRSSSPTEGTQVK